MSDKLNVLFLCTGNSCRSQMAEAWARHLKGNVINAYSAGVETHGLNPNAVQVMKELEIDMSNHQSQHIDEFKEKDLDIIVTVCGHANETCPIFPRKTKVIHVGFDDPPKLAKEVARNGGSIEDQLDCYRKVRDEIKTFVEKIPQVLLERSE